MFKEVIQYRDLNIAALLRRSDRRCKSSQWCIDGAETRVRCILLQKKTLWVRLNCWLVQTVVLHTEVQYFRSCYLRASHFATTWRRFSHPWLSRESHLVVLLLRVNAVHCSFRRQNMDLRVLILLRRANDRELDFTALVRLYLSLILWLLALISQRRQLYILVVLDRWALYKHAAAFIMLRLFSWRRDLQGVSHAHGYLRLL